MRRLWWRLVLTRHYEGRISCAVAALAILSSSGCSNSDRDTAIADGERLSQVAVEAAALARDVVADCMIEEGFDVPFETGPSSEAIVSVESFSVTDADRSFAYGISTQSPESYGGAIDLNQLDELGASEASDRRLDVDEIDELGGDAELVAYEQALDRCASLGTEATLRHTEEYRQRSEPSEGDTSFSVPSEGDWADCMRAAGFDVQNRADLRSQIRERLDDALASPDESSIEERISPVQALERSAYVSDLTCGGLGEFFE